MKRTKISTPISQNQVKAILNWAQNFPYFCYFNPRQTEGYPQGTFTHQLALSSKKINLSPCCNFDSLKTSLLKSSDQHLFGYFSYDLKNELEHLSSENDAWINWPQMIFFRAECTLFFKEDHLIIETDNSEYYEAQIRTILELETDNSSQGTKTSFTITPQTSKAEYINTVKKLQNHIVEGDIYEINYCMNYTAETSNFDPITSYLSLSQKSPTPFACLLKAEARYILCASPERFTKLEEGKIISQPIKGTAKRSAIIEEDEKLRHALRNSEKERAENMMIVDLVRNDLAKSSKAGTVKVEEMFGIYSFAKVHQMISTIVAEAKEGVHSVDIIKNAFPMGSMTGAPKIRAMQLIEQYENSKRGAFSGSIGYFKGANKFDFNVVIRSIFFDKNSGKLNYQVGSAITHDSDPEQEYEECLLKAQAIEEVLNH
ncbi:para-aminobenzoate synthase [Marivirga lumbricoides]|uniref:Para-aminobenzoate synthase n=1 Tax=Marivirga lumbricoides TaxID=1046115 RepID=A0ABQ1LZE6_9BACT|nr:para-aminobenzoate synthase [Marivirga lumbricoides]